MLWHCWFGGVKGIWPVEMMLQQAEKVFLNPSGCWSTAPHVVVLTLMRERYYCVYLYMLLVDVLTHAVDLHKTASR